MVPGPCHLIRTPFVQNTVGHDEYKRVHFEEYTSVKMMDHILFIFKYSDRCF